VRWVLGGWQWSGVMQYQTGRPYTVTSGTDNSLDGIGNDRAKLTGADLNAVPTTAVRLHLGVQPAAFAAERSAHVRQRRQGAYYGPSMHSCGHGRVQELPLQQRHTSCSGARRVLQHFNQVNLDVPNTAVNNQATLGRITRHRSGVGRSPRSCSSA
jgi:hypothetical protein